MGHTLRIVVAFLFCALLTTPGLADPWKFIAVGDSRGSNNGVNTTILGELAAEIVAQDPALVVFPGDLVAGYNSQAALESQLLTWRNTMQPVYDAGIAVYPVRGNHDIGTGTYPYTTAWNNVFSGVYALPRNGPAGELNLTYSVAHQNALFLGLDEYIAPHRVNQTWIDEQLVGNTKPHVFAFGHEPAFRAEHSDCLDDYAAERNAFWESLEGAGSRAYFCGHDHFFDQASTDDDDDPSNDVHQFIVGTAGAPLYPWPETYPGDNGDWALENVYHAKQHGYILGKIDGLEATLTWMERTAPGAYEAKHTWAYTTAVPEPPMLQPSLSGPSCGGDDAVGE